jgi:hypothetical protein
LTRAIATSAAGRVLPWLDACSERGGFRAGVALPNKEALMNWIERSLCIATLAGTSMLGIACGSSQLPAKQLADAEAGIRAAREVGAQDTPKAALQLKLAQDGVQRAQAQSKEGDDERATATLEEAKVDAELAVLLAKQEESEARAHQAQSRAGSVEQAKSNEETPKEELPSVGE